jgi:hypothetical protein
VRGLWFGEEICKQSSDREIRMKEAAWKRYYKREGAIKMNLKYRMASCGLGSSASGQGQVASFCGHRNEPSGSVTSGEFLSRFENCYLHQKHAIPWIVKYYTISTMFTQPRQVFKKHWKSGRHARHQSHPTAQYSKFRENQSLGAHNIEVYALNHGPYTSISSTGLQRWNSTSQRAVRNGKH